MTFIQKDLTTTPYELPGISWELTEDLYTKWQQYLGFSKLIFSEDGTELVDIVEDLEKREKARQIQEERENKEKEIQKKKTYERQSKGTSAVMSAVYATKMLLPSLATTISSDNESILYISGLFDTWVEGTYKIGDYRNYNNQVWECVQDNDTADMPNVIPDNPEWMNYWRPIHGRSENTARKWVKPTNEQNKYYVDEYMWYTDYNMYRCKTDTSLSPEESPDSWEQIIIEE